MRKKIKDNPLSVITILKGRSGFTLLELMFVVIILTVIMAIALPVYFGYLDKARITVAVATLDTMQKDIESYHMDINMYPQSISSDTCVDEQGRRVFSPDFCQQMKKDLYSGIESYALASESYILTARATDTKHTLLTLTASAITKEGN
jgi:prepilin-type N-terminal cleavage/methylation domain-containing protein